MTQRATRAATRASKSWAAETVIVREGAREGAMQYTGKRTGEVGCVALLLSKDRLDNESKRAEVIIP